MWTVQCGSGHTLPGYGMYHVVRVFSAQDVWAVSNLSHKNHNPYKINIRHYMDSLVTDF